MAFAVVQFCTYMPVSHDNPPAHIPSPLIFFAVCSPHVAMELHAHACCAHYRHRPGLDPSLQDPLAGSSHPLATPQWSKLTAAGEDSWQQAAAERGC
jgi:hypothetical protein